MTAQLCQAQGDILSNFNSAHFKTTILMNSFFSSLGKYASFLIELLIAYLATVILWETSLTPSLIYFTFSPGSPGSPGSPRFPAGPYKKEKKRERNQGWMDE